MSDVTPPPFAAENNPVLLSQWVLYDHPADYPDTYIARRWVVATGAYAPTEDIIQSDDLDSLRRLMQGMALSRITRSPEDDPKIIEVWL